MKKIISTCLVLVFIFFTVSCGNNKAKTALNDIKDITQVKISSAMGDTPVNDKILPMEHAHMVVEKLKSYSYTLKEQENKEGFVHNIAISYKDIKDNDKTLNISFIDDYALINSVEYDVKNYKADDFNLFLE